MSEPQEVTGGCLCGAVQFRIALPTLFCAHCHCRMCQRSHGAGYVTWFAVPSVQIEIEKGESDLVRHASSDHGTRTFCSHCGSSMFCESTHHPDQVDVVLASMDGRIDREPGLHIFFDHRAPWVRIGDDLPRLGGETGMEPTESESS